MQDAAACVPAALLQLGSRAAAANLLAGCLPEQPPLCAPLAAAAALLCSCCLQETHSCYDRWLNPLLFNFGYHVEHHDFNNIPWTR